MCTDAAAKRNWHGKERVCFAKLVLAVSSVTLRPLTLNIDPPRSRPRASRLWSRAGGQSLVSLIYRSPEQDCGPQKMYSRIFFCGVFMLFFGVAEFGRKFGENSAKSGG